VGSLGTSREAGGQSSRAVCAQARAVAWRSWGSWFWAHPKAACVRVGHSCHVLQGSSVCAHAHPHTLHCMRHMALALEHALSQARPSKQEGTRAPAIRSRGTHAPVDGHANSAGWHHHSSRRPRLRARPRHRGLHAGRAVGGAAWHARTQGPARPQPRAEPPPLLAAGVGAHG